MGARWLTRLEHWAADQQAHVQDLLMPQDGGSSRSTLQLLVWKRATASRSIKYHFGGQLHRDTIGPPKWASPFAGKHQCFQPRKRKKKKNVHSRDLGLTIFLLLRWWTSPHQPWKENLPWVAIDAIPSVLITFFLQCWPILILETFKSKDYGAEQGSKWKELQDTGYWRKRKLYWAD